ncbi:MAG TPA: hypothetical protein VGM05_09115, partial [Planctomycetaceae bacterium]
MVVRAGLPVFLLIVGGSWYWNFHRMQQIEELVNASTGGGGFVQRAPSWSARLLGAELLPWFQEPKELWIHDKTLDEAWFSKLRLVNEVSVLDLSNTQFS